MNLPAIKYCLYLMYKGSKIEHVVEYYDTYESLIEAYYKYPTSNDYTVHIGEFVSTYDTKSGLETIF